MASQSLNPPPQTRNRASSTNLRSNITFHTLGRRRSNSCLLVPDAPLTLPLETLVSTEQTKSPSMLDRFVSHFIHWLHIPQKHAASWSTPSSPRSSAEDFVLPLSIPTQTVSFTATEVDEATNSSSPLSSWRFRSFSDHVPILIVILLLPVSTTFVLWCLSTLPISLSWPHNISDLAQLGRELHGYSQSGIGPLSHVIGVMAISAIWKHAWSVPGSVLWNVLAGALFSPVYATILLTTLTTVGSACATLLSTPLGPFLAYLFPRALDMTRNALGADSDSDRDDPSHQSKPKTAAWVRLSVLRLIGVVPWSGINIACGVCGVSLTDCMLGTFIGCLPWTAVTCQIGDILQTVASTPTSSPQTVSSLLTTPEIILKLVFLSVISLAPILGRAHLRSMISTSPRASDAEKQESKWAWVQDWRTKISMSSRSRERQQDHHDLNILVQEKQRLEDYSS
ncbi:snare associated Golgi protein-domain-containing protein [Crassisporium funariophilum]|nr:snare associated Golgi protein-domain-containing protein [Crassisporium funariophilum]